MAGRDRTYDYTSLAVLVEDGLRQDKTLTQIAREVGASQSTLSRVMRETPGLSLDMRPSRRRTLRHKLRPVGLEMGCLTRPLDAQPRDFQEWIYGQAVRSGVTVAEALVALALDQFHDERDAQSRAA